MLHVHVIVSDGKSQSETMIINLVNSSTNSSDLRDIDDTEQNESKPARQDNPIDIIPDYRADLEPQSDDVYHVV